MAKRPDLASVAVQHDKRATVANSTVTEKKTTTSFKPPSREGKKAVTAWLEKEAWHQLRVMGLDQEKPVQLLMVEAVNMLFTANGKPPIAK